MPLPLATDYKEGHVIRTLEDGVYKYYRATKKITPAIYMPVYPTGAAKSLVFSFMFEDTLSAGDRVQRIIEERGALPDRVLEVMRAVPYTDNNGFLENATFKLINFLNPSWSQNNLVDFDRYSYTAMDAPAVIKELINRGGRLKEYSVFNVKLHKDLGERLGLTQQLQFLGYEDIIGVGNEWARLCNLVIDLPGPALYLYVSDDYYEKLEDKFIKDDAIQIGNISSYATIDGFKLKLNQAGISEVSTWASWAIGDNSGKLWLFVNQFNGVISTISPKPTDVQPGTIEIRSDEYQGFFGGDSLVEENVIIIANGVASETFADSALLELQSSIFASGVKQENIEGDGLVTSISGIFASGTASETDTGSAEDIDIYHTIIADGIKQENLQGDSLINFISGIFADGNATESEIGNTEVIELTSGIFADGFKQDNLDGDAEVIELTSSIFADGNPTQSEVGSANDIELLSSIFASGEKFEEPQINLIWISTISQPHNGTINLGSVSNCPTQSGYLSQLPDANNYSEDFIMRVVSGIFDGETLNPCPTLYYKAVAE